MLSTDDAKFYYNFNWPFQFWSWLLTLQKDKRDFANPDVNGNSINREWFSQPRTFSDGGVEVITTTFKLPLSVSEITMEILRMPCSAEVWYQDRSNNWRQLLDVQRIPLQINVSRSDTKNYFKYQTKCYPIVAKKIQFRLQRTDDLTLANIPFPLGLKNCLIRRNVYDRTQGSQYFEEEQDVLGNVISKYIKDWDATKANDNDPHTFWKSGPMPDPAAVASLYLDVRNDLGGPKAIDRVYIDPVYTGQHLNLYYSSDDTVGVRKLSPITIAPDSDVNTDWRIGRGRSDVSTGNNESYYRWSMSLGPLNSQNFWIGIEWTPNFDPNNGPSNNPVLFRATSSTGPAFKPELHYDVGSNSFVLNLSDGTTTRTYVAPSIRSFNLGNTLRIVAGWQYSPDKVCIKVIDQSGKEIASLNNVVTNLPHLVSVDGQVEMYRFRGIITALLMKLESFEDNGDSFLNSPSYYVDPDPVIPDGNGIIPSTTLDHAVYAYAATTQEHGSGGASDTAYEDKEWTPIWRDYVAEKGMLMFPQTISMKYLKLEFTNLTEEPYPIYESGIEVRYKVFPVSVMQQSSYGQRTYTGEGGFLGLGTFISRNGVRSINWMNSNSVREAADALFGTTIDPVSITNGSPFITSTLPNQGAIKVIESSRLEAASSYVYVRDTLQPYVMAEDAYVTIIKAEGLQAISAFTDVPWQDIEAANPKAITHVKSTGTLPIRGTDWYIFPGQQLRLSANVMKKLTDTSTITERKFTLENRIRFNTTSIHRYEYKTLKRDAAIAYFAGLREVQPYTSTFIAGEDKPSYEFSHYDTDQFVTNRIRQNDAGSTTTQRKIYRIENRLFERNLNSWNPDSSAWSWDGTIGRWLRGTAKCTIDGVDHTLISNRYDVAAGDTVKHSLSIKWANLTGLDPNDVAIRWAIRYFAGTTFVSDQPLKEISYPSWTSNLTKDWQDLVVNQTAPAGVDGFRIVLQVTNQASGGRVWFENVKAEDANTTTATLFKSVQTMSTFNKVSVDFRDSGLWRGDSMWADINPDSQSIDDEKLAYYTRTIPETMPGTTWADTNKAWSADDAEWGSPFGIVSVTVDSDRRYQGKRVLHFRRAAGAGEAGIKVKQWTHYVPMGLFRIGCVFYKPLDNDNEATVRLRRLADGVIVYEETVVAPAGQWFDFKTKFVEIPDGANQEYEVYLTLTGDDEDELYLSDLYTEIANIRYFVRLGGTGAYLHEVTDLRYVDGRANVTTTTPVNQFSIQAAILSPEAWAYGATVTPNYLK